MPMLSSYTYPVGPILFPPIHSVILIKKKHYSIFILHPFPVLLLPVLVISLTLSIISLLLCKPYSSSISTQLLFHHCSFVSFHLCFTAPSICFILLVALFSPVCRYLRCREPNISNVIHVHFGSFFSSEELL